MMISNVSTLKQRLKQNLEQDREQTEALTKEQLQKLSENLKIFAEKEQVLTEKGLGDLFGNLRNSITAEIESTDLAMDLSQTRQSVQDLKTLLTKTWITPLVIGLSLLIGISGGTWGLMQYLTWRVQDLMNDKRQIITEIQEQQRTLKFLEDGTWGLTLNENENGRFVIFSARDRLERKGLELTVYSLDNREVVKLIRRK